MASASRHPTRMRVPSARRRQATQRDAAPMAAGGRAPHVASLRTSYERGGRRDHPTDCQSECHPPHDPALPSRPALTTHMRARHGHALTLLTPGRRRSPPPALAGAASSASRSAADAENCSATLARSAATASPIAPVLPAIASRTASRAAVAASAAAAASSTPVACAAFHSALAASSHSRRVGVARSAHARRSAVGRRAPGLLRGRRCSASAACCSSVRYWSRTSSPWRRPGCAASHDALSASSSCSRAGSGAMLTCCTLYALTFHERGGGAPAPRRARRVLLLRAARLGGLAFRVAGRRRRLRLQLERERGEALHVRLQHDRRAGWRLRPLPGGGGGGSTPTAIIVAQPSSSVVQRTARPGLLAPLEDGDRAARSVRAVAACDETAAEQRAPDERRRRKRRYPSLGG